MSTADLYILNRNSVSHAAAFSNGWGSGPVVWRHLGETYIADKPQYWQMNLGVLREIWALAGSLGERRHSQHARGVVLSCTSVSDHWAGADATRIAKVWSIFDRAGRG